MANDLTPMQSFQEKMADRLRESIADMVPPAVLKTMVDAAIAENLKGPHFRQLVSDTMKQAVDLAIEDYRRDHKEEIGKQAADLVVKLAPELIAMWVESLITGQMYQWMNNDNAVRLIRDRIRQLSF